MGWLPELIFFGWLLTTNQLRLNKLGFLQQRRVIVYAFAGRNVEEVEKPLGVATNVVRVESWLDTPSVLSKHAVDEAFGMANDGGISSTRQSGTLVAWQWVTVKRYS